MLSAKAEQFTESVIREMTRLALEHNAVNLSQGFPDFAAPAEIKEAARQAIADDINQYAITWGAKPLRDAIVEKFERTQGVRVDPEREITICCGSTEAMMSAMMAIINPGDEIVVFEPFYENYGPDAILSGATPRFVKLRPPDWTYDEKELAAAFGPRYQGHHPQYAEQSHRQSFHARRAGIHSRSLRALECLLHHRRNLRAHSLRRRGTYLHGAHRWHARTHHRDQRNVENLQRDRLAGGLGHCSAGADRGNSQGARFSDRGRGCAVAAGRRHAR